MSSSEQVSDTDYVLNTYQLFLPPHSSPRPQARARQTQLHINSQPRDLQREQQSKAVAGSHYSVSRQLQGQMALAHLLIYLIS